MPNIQCSCRLFWSCLCKWRFYLCVTFGVLSCLLSKRKWYLWRVLCDQVVNSWTNFYCFTGPVYRSVSFFLLTDAYFLQLSTHSPKCKLYLEKSIQVVLCSWHMIIAASSKILCMPFHKHSIFEAKSCWVWCIPSHADLTSQGVESFQIIFPRKTHPSGYYFLSRHILP